MFENLPLQRKRRQLFLDLEKSMRCALNLDDFPNDFVHRTGTLGLRWNGWVPRNQEIIFFTVTPSNYPEYQEGLKVLGFCKGVLGKAFNIDALGPYRFPGALNMATAIEGILYPAKCDFNTVCKWDNVTGTGMEDEIREKFMEAEGLYDVGEGSIKSLNGASSSTNIH